MNPRFLIAVGNEVTGIILGRQYNSWLQAVPEPSSSARVVEIW